jgi:cytochrome c-type biogenesis protein CcmE
MKTKVLVKIAIGIVVIGGGIGYLMYQAIQSSSSYYYSVDDFIRGSDEVKNSSLRLAGKVKAGSVQRDIEKMLLSFTLSGEKTEIPVSYSKTVPENFTEGIEVVVSGRLDASGGFQADKLMTRCESKYKAKLEP